MSKRSRNDNADGDNGSAFEDQSQKRQKLSASPVMASEEKYTFFYTKQSPFSQFYPACFKVNGVDYSCAEQFMMHQKAKLFEDIEIAEKILKEVKPLAMKRLGRKVKNFDQDNWMKNRKDIVKRGSIAKFSQNPDILKLLLATEGTVLVEASPRDRIWGIGMAASNPAASNKQNWRGQNLLGYILTEVREELKKTND